MPTLRDHAVRVINTYSEFSEKNWCKYMSSYGHL